jgi:guanylate kinase
LRGVILYGPPASGKSSITRLLEESGQFSLLQRLKVGGGRSDEYRMITTEHLALLRKAGQVVWENTRYGATYVVDREGLEGALTGTTVPVLHLGQIDGVEAVTVACRPEAWLVVELWADLLETESRLVRRGGVDVQERLRAWAETPPLTAPDLRLDTSRKSPQAVALAIRRGLFRGVERSRDRPGLT